MFVMWGQISRRDRPPLPPARRTGKAILTTRYFEVRALSRKGPGKAEPDDVAPKTGADPVAVGRAQVHSPVVPGAAAKNPESAVDTNGQGRTIYGRPLITIVPAILHPFPDIAMHIMKTKPVRAIGANSFRARSIGRLENVKTISPVIFRRRPPFVPRIPTQPHSTIDKLRPFAHSDSR